MKAQIVQLPQAGDGHKGTIYFFEEENLLVIEGHSGGVYARHRFPNEDIKVLKTKEVSADLYRFAVAWEIATAQLRKALVYERMR